MSQMQLVPHSKWQLKKNKRKVRRGKKSFLHTQVETLETPRAVSSYIISNVACGEYTICQCCVCQFCRREKLCLQSRKTKFAQWASTPVDLASHFFLSLPSLFLPSFFVPSLTPWVVTCKLLEVSSLVIFRSWSSLFYSPRLSPRILALSSCLCLVTVASALLIDSTNGQHLQRRMQQSKVWARGWESERRKECICAFIFSSLWVCKSLEFPSALHPHSHADKQTTGPFNLDLWCDRR